jgi:hypothetical protein
VATYNPPSVPAFPAGYGPTQLDFDNWWYQTAAFLQNRVVFRATQTTTATSLPDSGASTLIHFDDVLEDPYSGWDSGTWMWTPPAGYSGWYQATLLVRTVAVGADVDLRPILAGTYGQALATAQGTTAFGAGVSGTFTVYLVGGQDTIGGACELLNSGSAVNTSLTAGQQSALELVWISQS